MISSLRGKILGRLILVAVTLASIAGGGIYFLERRSIDQRIFSLALDETRSLVGRLDFLSEPRRPDSDQVNSRIASHLLAEHIDEGHFVGIEIYDLDRRKVAEAVHPDFRAVAEAVDAHHLTPGAGDPYAHAWLNFQGVSFVQVLAPLQVAGKTVAYFDGIFRVDPETMRQMNRGLALSVLLVVLVVLATAGVFYPIMLRLNGNLLRLSDDLAYANMGMLAALGSAVARRDRGTNAHNYRVTIYAIHLARALGLSVEQIRGLVKGAFLHDVGKIGIADAILRKPGRLTPEEILVMQEHVRYGVEMVGKFDWLKDAVDVVRCHHERFDGLGYPAGLRGEEIPITARIFAVVDVFDALTTRRPYKAPIPVEETMRHLEEGRGSHFDPGRAQRLRVDRAGALPDQLGRRRVPAHQDPRPAHGALLPRAPRRPRRAGPAAAGPPLSRDRHRQRDRPDAGPGPGARRREVRLPERLLVAPGDQTGPGAAPGSARGGELPGRSLPRLPGRRRSPREVAPAWRRAPAAGGPGSGHGPATGPALPSPGVPQPRGGPLNGRLRTLLSLAWPIMVSRSAQVVVGVSDAVMVAHLGATALAATTTGAMNSFSLLILPMGVVFIVSSFASQLFGMGDAAGARRYGWYGLGVAAVTQVAGVAALPAVDGLLGLLDLAPDVRSLMTGYLVIRLWSGGAAVGLEALGNYYGGLGNTRRPMVAQLAAMVLNVGGNWLLIDGHLGLPAMGVAGAALASSISTWLAFLGLLAGFWLEGRRLQPGRAPLRLAELGRMLRFGLPSGLNWFFEFFAFNFFVTVIVAGLGTTTLAALMAVFQVNSVAFMPSFGIASAGAILVGQAIGAGRKDEVPALVGLTFRVCAGWQALVGLVYVVDPALVFAPFAVDPVTGPALLASRAAHAGALHRLAALRRGRRGAGRGPARRRGHRLHALGAAGDRLGALRARRLGLGARARVR